MAEPISFETKRQRKAAATGGCSFLSCACSPEFGSTMLVLVTHDAAGSFISGLVCSECETMLEIAHGRPVA